jgi:hypothetical protein
MMLSTLTTANWNSFLFRFVLQSFSFEIIDGKHTGMYCINFATNDIRTRQ